MKTPWVGSPLSGGVAASSLWITCSRAFGREFLARREVLLLACGLRWGQFDLGAVSFRWPLAITTPVIGKHPRTYARVHRGTDLRVERTTPDRLVLGQQAVRHHSRRRCRSDLARRVQQCGRPRLGVDQMGGPVSDPQPRSAPVPLPPLHARTRNRQRKAGTGQQSLPFSNGRTGSDERDHVEYD
jgi:hypothetical protein